MKQSIDEMLDSLAAALGAATIHELIDVYETNSASQLAKIEQALADNDYKVVKSEAHGLKSSSANMGALELSQICLQIESAGSMTDAVRLLAREARALHPEVITLMRDWVKRNP